MKMDRWLGRLGIAVCFVFLGGAVFAQEAGPSAATLKLAFWNLEWFPGGHPDPTNREAVAQIVKVVPAVEKLDVDILGMEEVLDWDAGTVAIFRWPGASVQVASEFLDPRGDKTSQQLVIASRLPALGAWWEVWKAGQAVTPVRGFAFAAFQPVPGRVLLVYCVHLKSNRGELAANTAMREESARQLLEHVAAMEKAYQPLGEVSVVVGGDFNTSTDDSKFQMERTLPMMEAAGFVSCWANVPFANRVTLPSKPSYNPAFPPWPDACFDHAFVKGATVRSASAVAVEPAPSDHRPVVLEIELPPAPAKPQ